MNINKSFVILLFLCTSIISLGQNTKHHHKDEVNKEPNLMNVGKRWSVERAKEWYASYPWLNGCDYIPRTAINQLEMWQASTFDTATINQELGWAENIGFNTLRVFLHSLAWKGDPQGFKDRINIFLNICTIHHIKPLFVFFDDVWNPNPKIGKQPEPKPGVHNSGWVADPGATATDTSTYPFLKSYMTDILTTFKNDPRILLWDLYNEPGNSGRGDTILPLVKKAFEWARAVNPSQPLTVDIFNYNFALISTYAALHSDIMTYHCYGVPHDQKAFINTLRLFNRPIICTEYMARTINCRITNVTPVLKEYNVGAINWGFVEGKTNTIYAWDTPIPDGSQPVEWFHDLFWPDGTPYYPAEINEIKKLNGKSVK